MKNIKNTIVALVVFVFSVITVASAATGSSKESADLKSAVEFFKGSEKAALEAAIAKLESATPIPAEHQQALQNLQKTAMVNAERATGKNREDAQSFAHAISVALGGTSLAPTASGALAENVGPRQSGPLSKSTPVVWSDEDAEAPSIEGLPVEHLGFSAKIALFDLGLTAEQIKAQGGVKAVVASKLAKTGMPKQERDIVLYAHAALQGVEYLKGGPVPSDISLITLDECGGQLRLSGKGSQLKQKLDQRKLGQAIAEVISKATGTVSPTPVVIVPSAPAPASPNPVAPTTKSVTTGKKLTRPKAPTLAPKLASDDHASSGASPTPPTK